jgi:membrane protease YdiL (CAAX protease family)
VTAREVRSVIVFYALAVGLAWLVALPFWLSERGLEVPYALVLLIAMMATPAIAALLTGRVLVPEPDLRTSLGLVVGRNVLAGLVASTLGVAALVVAAPFVAAALGLYPLDLAGFSGFRELLAKAGQAEALDQAGLPLALLVALQLVAGLPTALIVNSVPALGEELGWRGFLLPRLQGLGRWPALVVSGALWGLWHAPVVALGYNYPHLPPLGAVGMMVGMCVVLGVLFGWLRTFTGAVWAPTFAHATLNGYAGSVALFHHAGFTLESSVVGITGWTGWLLPLAAIVVLAVSGVLPGRDPALTATGSR